MQAATYDLEERIPGRDLFTQVAITLFLGIPMTIALAIALAVYCAYECIKYALSDKRQTGSIAKVPVAASEEQKFTAALTRFAGIHAETPKVDISGPPVLESAGGDREDTANVGQSTKKATNEKS